MRGSAVLLDPSPQLASPVPSWSVASQLIAEDVKSIWVPELTLLSPPWQQKGGLAQL